MIDLLKVAQKLYRQGKAKGKNGHFGSRVNSCQEVGAWKEESWKIY